MFIAPSIRFFTRHLDHVEIHINLGAECMTLTEVALLLLSLAAEGLVLVFSETCEVSWEEMWSGKERM